MIRSTADHRTRRTRCVARAACRRLPTARSTCRRPRTPRPPARMATGTVKSSPRRRPPIGTALLWIGAALPRPAALRPHSRRTGKEGDTMISTRNEAAQTPVHRTATSRPRPNRRQSGRPRPACAASIARAGRIPWRKAKRSSRSPATNLAKHPGGSKSTNSTARALSTDFNNLRSGMKILLPEGERPDVLAEPSSNVYRR